MKLLGPILMDYNDLTMKFCHEDRLVELCGDRESELTLVTPRQLRRMVRSNTASAFFHLCIEPLPTQTTLSSNSTHNQSPAISNLINQYRHLFQPLTTLPPPRTTNHFITLIPNASLINV